MSSRNLREWLELLKSNGELVEIEEKIDWKFEMGCLMRRIFDIPRGGPAKRLGYKGKSKANFRLESVLGFFRLSAI